MTAGGSAQYHATIPHMKRLVTAPTDDGASSGVESSSGMSWTFEDPRQHWENHDVRQVRYWRARPPAERLARAAAYRIRRDGSIPAPVSWTWRFLGRGEQ